MGETNAAECSAFTGGRGGSAALIKERKCPTRPSGGRDANLPLVAVEFLWPDGSSQDVR
jgi:hypothetical protein